MTSLEPERTARSSSFVFLVNEVRRKSEPLEHMIDFLALVVGKL